MVFLLFHFLLLLFSSLSVFHEIVFCTVAPQHAKCIHMSPYITCIFHFGIDAVVELVYSCVHRQDAIDSYFFALCFIFIVPSRLNATDFFHRNNNSDITCNFHLYFLSALQCFIFLFAVLQFFFVFCIIFCQSVVIINFNSTLHSTTMSSNAKNSCWCIWIERYVK